MSSLSQLYNTVRKVAADDSGPHFVGLPGKAADEADCPHVHLFFHQENRSSIHTKMRVAVDPATPLSATLPLFRTIMAPSEVAQTTLADEAYHRFGAADLARPVSDFSRNCSLSLVVAYEKFLKENFKDSASSLYNSVRQNQ